MSNGIVIVAGGRGERMRDEPGAPVKQLRPLMGRPVIQFTLELFDRLSCVDCLCLVARPKTREEIEAKGLVADLSKPLYWAEGGEQRQDSSRNGVRALPDAVDVVGVHDAVRPFPPWDATTKAFDLARRHGAAILAVPVSDTLKRGDDLRQVVETVDRSDLWLAQTPQVFQREWLMEAFEFAEASKARLTDEASAVEAMGRPVRLTPSTKFNMKITTSDDLVMAEAIARHLKGLMPY